MENQTGQTEKNKLTSTQKILIIGMIVLILIVSGFGIALLLKPAAPAASDDQSDTVETTGNVIMDDDNFENVIADMQRKAKEGNFRVKMNMAWTFPDGASASPDAYVANSEANHGPVTFQVLLEDTGEVIYTSPELPLGSKVADITLTKDLEPGTYNCICQYQLFTEDKKENGKVAIALTINVLE